MPLFKAPKDCLILDALSHYFPDSSKATLRSWLKQGRIVFEGNRVISAKTPLKSGVSFEVLARATFIENDIKIVYEDEDLVVIDKPEKFLSVALDHGNADNVHAVLKRRAKKAVYPVHRLDRDTSGILVFAYSSEARSGLKKLFAEHAIERVYMALVEGFLNPSRGKWESHLKEDASYFVRSSPEGKKAITHFETIKTGRHSSLVRFTLETGRKNQIRVQAAQAGHPILGDRKYGNPHQLKKRLCLHAHVLGFKHPCTGKYLRFTSPLPTFFS